MLPPVSRPLTQHACRHLHAALALALATAALNACSSSKKEGAESGSGGSRMNEILFPDRTKESPMNNKMFKSKEFSNKEYKTGEAAGLKKFTGTKWFNAKAYQTQDYATKRFSPAGQFAAESGREARTSTAAGMDKTAPTKSFALSKEEFGTKDYSDRSKRFAGSRWFPGGDRTLSPREIDSHADPTVRIFTDENPTEPNLDALRALLGKSSR